MPKNTKKSSSLSSKKASNEKPNLQYRRSRNDDGNDDGNGGSDVGDNDVEEFDKVEYAKLLAELFPSKYSVNKAKIMQNAKIRHNKQIVDSEEEEEQEE